VIQWSYDHLPEPSLEPPYQREPERWCDECEYYTDEEGVRFCLMYQVEIKDMREANGCTGYMEELFL